MERSKSLNMTSDNIEEVRREFVRKIYTAIVLNSYSIRVRDICKIQDYEKFVSVLKRHGIWAGTREFLDTFPKVFILSDENNFLVVKPVVCIEFCRDFDGKRGCDTPGCPKLHVCRHFVKGKCTFGPRCKKPHHFQNGETRKLLRQHYLDEVNEDQVREFLCRNVQHLLEPDASNAELPKCLEICKYYNVATGCTREFCPFLHVCRFYAEEGNCKFGNQCIRKHDINNNHARVLLKRYLMDALNEDQVMTFLKLKAEGRELQGQVLNGLLKDKNGTIPLTQGLPLSNLPRAFSLPSTIFGALQLLNDGLPRKLSHPAPVITRHIVTQPNPPSQSLCSASPRPTPVKEKSTHLSALTPPALVQSVSGAASMSSKVQTLNTRTSQLSQSGRPTGLRNLRPDYTLIRPNYSSPLSAPVHDTTATTMPVTHNLNTFYLNTNRHPNASYPGSLPTSNEHMNPADLGFRNLLANGNPVTNAPQSNGHKFHSFGSVSPPTSETKSPISSVSNFGNPQTIESKCSFNGSISEGRLELSNLMNHMSKSLDDTTSQLASARRHSHRRPSLSCTSIREEVNHTKEPDSFFSLQPFSHQLPNDALSRKSSSSSSNGTPCSSHEDSFYTNSISFVDGDTSPLSYCSHDDEGDMLMSYYRTRSLPNVSSSKLNRNRNETSVPTTGVVPGESNCVCNQTEICSYFLRRYCAFQRSCSKVHVKEAFQWQIYSHPLERETSSHVHNNSYFKNENFSNSPPRGRWVNLDKSENLKLELAFCSVDLDNADVDISGETFTVKFDDMMAVARSGLDELTQSRTCDLSGWLLQMSDESPARRGSHECATYKIRRLSTPSSSESLVTDVVYATTWKWYWLDGFGMWRPFISRTAEIIDKGNTCYVEDIERAFLQGVSSHMFEQQQIRFDFSTMQQLICTTGKTRKIRRRPDFISKEDLDQRIRMDMVRMTTLIELRPWYWSHERNVLSSEFEVIELNESSDIFKTVRHHFSRSMHRLDFQILSIQSIQNTELWANFIRCKMNLASSGIQASDRFLFKASDESSVRGICQQGFPFCTCQKDGTETDYSRSNIFSREACHIIGRCKPNSIGTRFMFCLRTFLPAAQNEEESNSEIVHSFGKGLLDLFRGFNLSESYVDSPDRSLVACRYPCQVYPEFLISFKL